MIWFKCYNTVIFTYLHGRSFSLFNSVLIVVCLAEMTEMTEIAELTEMTVTSSFENGTIAEEGVFTNLQRSLSMQILYIFAGCFGIPGNIITIVVILR